MTFVSISEQSAEAKAASPIRLPASSNTTFQFRENRGRTTFFTLTSYSISSIILRRSIHQPLL
jgi:hypothetical protein